MTAMLTLFVWRKVGSSVILFALHCISRRELVGRRELGGEAVPASAAPLPIRRLDEYKKFGSFGCRHCR